MSTHDHGVDQHEDGPESAQRNIHAELARKKAKLARVAIERNDARDDLTLLRERHRKALREAISMVLAVDELMGDV